MSVYSATTNGELTCSTTTPKTILSLVNWSNGGFRIVEMGVSFAGTVATAEPVLVELMKSTEASAGTASTHSIERINGSEKAAQVTAKYDFTAEPTVLTEVAQWLVHPQAGLIVQWPLGREPEMFDSADAYVVRVTAPATVGCRAYLFWEE